MVSPSASRRRNSSQVAHCGTSSELAMRTRGAHGCVLTTPTGFPDWTSSVSSSSSSRSVATIASNAAQLRAARPEPPYTISSSGCSATSGSRLFMSIRMAASCGQPLQLSPVPRGARTGRGPLVAVIAGSSSSVDAAMIACCWGSASATPNPNTGGYRGSGKTVLRQPALGDRRVALLVHANQLVHLQKAIGRQLRRDRVQRGEQVLGILQHDEVVDQD